MHQIGSALYGRLAADLGTALGTVPGSLRALGFTAIYNRLAPTTAVYPVVVFNQQVGMTEWTFDEEAWRRNTYQVKAITPGHSAQVADMASERFDVLFNDKPLELDGYECLRLRRVQDVSYPEMDKGMIYHHVGGLYRIDVERA